MSPSSNPPTQAQGVPTPAMRQAARELVANLPLAERIQLVSGHDFWTTQPVEVPAEGTTLILRVSDGPHGLRRQAGASDHVGISDSLPATCFPVAAAMACTWDPSLLAEVGAALGLEARSQGVGILLGPGMNLKRHPRGGRNFEYFSEDPLLSGSLAAALVRGVQAQGVGACLKHFAANNQETARMVIDVIIDERTLREIYLRGFQIALRECPPAAVMTSYNQVNGQFASDHEHLLAQILRGEWGYDGLVLSDWGATNDRVAGLQVGMDLEMPSSQGAFDPAIAAAITSGTLDEAALDRSAARVVAATLNWAQTASQPAPEPDLQAHHELARRAAAAGTVLLANDGLLPLTGVGTTAVIGEFAVAPRYQGAGSSKVNPTRLECLRDALIEGVAGLGTVVYSPGYDAMTGDTTPSLLAAAASAAATADQVVLVIGLPASYETEGRDRSSWELPAGMDQVAEVVLAANRRVAVVLVSGGPVAMPWADRPAALLLAHLGGQAGGGALADVLLGSSEPGGRLAESIPHAASDLPSDANFPGQPRQVQYRECANIGYRFHTTHGVAARYVFGHGLGYTTFSYGPAAITGTGTTLTLTATLTNTGKRAGSEVVQVYIGKVDPQVPRPSRELAGYTKVGLQPGESCEVRVQLEPTSFRVFDAKVGRWLVDGGEYEVMVGSSAIDIRATTRVNVADADRVTPAAAPAGPIATDAEFAELMGGVVPPARPARPFTRLSTPAELRESALARPLVAALRRGMTRQFGSDAPDVAALVDAVLASMPLRAMVMISPRIGFPALDRLIAILNRDLRGVVQPSTVARGAGRGLR